MASAKREEVKLLSGDDLCKGMGVEGKYPFFRALYG